MNSRLLLSAGLAAIAAASQAAVIFTVKTSFTNGASGKINFTPVTAGNTISANVNRAAPSQPVTLNLDLKASTNAGSLKSVTYDLYFIPSAAGKLKGAFTYNPVVTGAGGASQDQIGGVDQITPDGLFDSITTLGSRVVIGGTTYTKVSRTINLAAIATKPSWHLILDDQYKNATLAMVDLSVQAVPEPATFAAFGLGLLGLCRRRKK